MKKGIDVSKWDPNMNWSLYDWDFAFIKVSEGLVIDPLFDFHWVNANGYTDRSGYHFFRAFVDPRESARRFIEYLDGDAGELPPVLDLESRNNIDKKTVVSRALTWLIEYEQRTAVKPIVYISEGFINELELYKYPDFEDYVLWLAQYPFDLIYDGYTEADRAVKLKSILDNPASLRIPPTPKPFKVMRYIQWTAKGNPFDVPGYYTGTGHKKAVDFNFQLEETNDLPRAGVTIKIIPNISSGIRSAA